MNNSQEMTVFSGQQQFIHETEARKVMVEFKFDALLSLHREPPEVG